MWSPFTLMNHFLLPFTRLHTLGSNYYVFNSEQLKGKLNHLPSHSIVSFSVNESIKCLEIKVRLNYLLFFSSQHGCKQSTHTHCSLVSGWLFFHLICSLLSMTCWWWTHIMHSSFNRRVKTFCHCMDNYIESLEMDQVDDEIQGNPCLFFCLNCISWSCPTLIVWIAILCTHH